MLSKLKRLFNPSERRSTLTSVHADDPELSWLDPPTDPFDVAAWDKYWAEQIRHGLGPPLFDIFCNDRDLVRVMNAERMRPSLPVVPDAGLTAAGPRSSVPGIPNGLGEILPGN